jgi:hypothetical protein
LKVIVHDLHVRRGARSVELPRFGGQFIVFVS